MTLLAASPTLHSITLSWTASSGGQTSFVLERSANGQTDWTPVANLGVDKSGYTDNGLPTGTTFYYRLTAVNAGGSTTSNMADARTDYAVLLPVIRR